MQLFKRYLEAYLSRFSNRNTLANIKADCRSLDAYFRRWDGGESEGQIIRYCHQLLEKGMAPQSARQRLIRMRNFYSFLVEKKYRKENPVNLDILPKSRNDRIILAPNQEGLRRLRKLLRLSPFHKLRDATMISLMYMEGLRGVEVTRAKLRDVQEVGEILYMDIHGKGNVESTIKLLPATEKIVRKYLREAKIQDPNAPLFFSLKRPGNRLTSRGVRLRVDKYFAMAGIKRKGISTHALRRSHASILHENGVPLCEISRRLRHSSELVTLGYIRHMPSTHDRRKAINDIVNFRSK